MHSAPSEAAHRVRLASDYLLAGTQLVETLPSDGALVWTTHRRMSGNGPHFADLDGTVLPPHLGTSGALMPHLPLRAAARALLALVCAGTVVLVAPGPASAAGPGVCAGVSTAGRGSSGRGRQRHARSGGALALRQERRTQRVAGGAGQGGCASHREGTTQADVLVRHGVAGIRPSRRPQRVASSWSATLPGRTPFCSAHRRGGAAGWSTCAPRAAAWIGGSTARAPSVPATCIRPVHRQAPCSDGSRTAGAVIRRLRGPWTATSGRAAGSSGSQPTTYPSVSEEVAWRWGGFWVPRPGALVATSGEPATRHRIVPSVRTPSYAERGSVHSGLSGSPGPAPPQISGRPGRR